MKRTLLNKTMLNKIVLFFAVGISCLAQQAVASHRKGPGAVRQQAALRAVPEVKKQETTKSSQKKTYSWAEVTKNSKDAVVQIFSYVSQYPIQAPYKTPDRAMGCGSGFVIKDDRGDFYIVTNFHVVNQAIALQAQFPPLGKEMFDLELVGANPGKDVAFLRLKDNAFEEVNQLLHAQNLELKYLELGDSDALTEAQEMMVLGYPLGQGFKCAIGWCSGREATEKGECIQTTAAVNRGNSGGPFFAQDGSVVGICVMKSSGADVEGIGYLIPINSIKLMFEELRTGMIIKNPFWGGVLEPTTEETLAFLGAPKDGGIYVAEVEKGSLFEEYGVLSGDIIVQINDQKLDRYGYIDSKVTEGKMRFGDYLDRCALSSDVKITLYRKGVQHEIIATVKQRQALGIDRFYPWYEEAPEYEIIGGLVVVQLTSNHLDALRESAMHYSYIDYGPILKYAKIENRAEPRVLVIDVLPESRVHKTHCFDAPEPDRVLSKINGLPVKTIDDFRAAVVAGKDSGYLTVETEGGKFMALSIKQILDDEPMLSQHYVYQASPLVAQLAA